MIIDGPEYDYTLHVHNPAPEPATSSIASELRRAAALFYS